MNNMKIVRLLFVFVCACGSGLALHAQEASTVQLWTDYLFGYPFKKVNLLETEFGYRTLLSSSNGIPAWHSFNITSTYKRSESRHVDILTALTFSYTVQNDTTNSFEIRPMVGVRLYFTPDSRLQTRLTIRYEHRFFKNEGEEGWRSATRLRIRPELIFPVNKPSFFVDKMLYVLTDIEFYISLDQQVHEAFSSRIRNRIGIGYRFNYNFRVEGIYTLQRSRNEIGKGFNTWDNIFRIRFKMYLPFKNKLFFHNKSEE
jgi:hypothetical protein